MDEIERETTMIRFECERCSMNATMVENDPAIAAWHAHMQIHDDATAFKCWSWRVYTIPWS